MAVQIKVPELGESIVEATVGRWMKKEGDLVKAGEPLVELETEKVNLEVGAEQAGVLAHIQQPEGADVKIGDVLGVIEPAAAGGQAPAEPPAPASKETEAAPAEVPAAEAAPTGEAQADEDKPDWVPVAAATAPRPEAQPAREPDRVTPVARRMGEALGLDLAAVPGSGPGGRITKEDVQAFAKPPQPNAPAPAAPASGDRREERVRLSRRRRTIARRLVEAQQTAALLTTFNELDMSAVIDIRQRRREAFKERHGVSLGFMSFFVKASIGALKAFPQLNAEIQEDEIILKHYYDIGIAVGAAEGLVVPVLRDADRMSFAQIEQTIKDLAQKAQAGTLALDDLRGGTFSLTNGGVFGSLLSTPIVNPPQVGILGLHKIEDRPVARDGQVVIKPMMYVALTYDHRIVDGREAVQFLVKVKELIEDPAALLIES